MKGKYQRTLTANFNLKVGDDALSMSAIVPDRAVTALELIPVFQQLCDDAVTHAVEQTLKTGQSISCQAGCCACCAQPIPTMSLEAENIAKVVKRMPKARQSRVRDRFAQSLAAIKDSGLDDALRAMPSMNPEDRLALGVEYFKLKLYCPFLENLYCSIYKERPLECREFLVTSEPKYCTELNAKEIKRVDSKLRLVPALRKLSQEIEGEGAESWMLLVYCLDLDKANKPRHRKKHGCQWLQDFIGHVVNRKLTE